MWINLKFAMKEEKKHIWIYLFVSIQIAITFLIGFCCSIIFFNQIDIYKKFDEILSKDGKFISSITGVRTPEQSIGSGASGISILKDNLKKTDIIGCYNLLGDIENEEDKLEWNIIVYDDEFVEIHLPVLKEGKWFEKDKKSGVLRAVISDNNYGVGVGDFIILNPYDKKCSDIIVEIIGVLDENAQIIKFFASDNMVSCRNFIGNCDNGNELPTLLLLQSDFFKIESGNWEELLWPAGMNFFIYDEDISLEERKSNEFFLDNYMKAQISENISSVHQKSVEYICGNLMEVFPILLISILFSIVTTISISVLGAKYAAENYYIYYIIGMSHKKCLGIQFCINLITLIVGFLLSSILIKIFIYPKMINNMSFDYRVLAVYFISGGIWLIISFFIQKKVLNRLFYEEGLK